FDMADRADGVRLVLHGDLVGELGDLREAAPGIAAHRHRRRAGVALLAGHGALDPAEALTMRDDADLAALGLQDRALLDMELEERLHRAIADRLVALPADARKLVAESL